MSAPLDCNACPLHQYRTVVVNGITVGDGRADLLVVGEGPGLQEDAQGRPFIGPTGAYLAQELRARGITSYALTNATRCYPGEDKKSSEMDAGVVACRPYLLDDIAKLRPKVILALGVYAVRALGFSDPMSTILCHVLDGPMGTPVVVNQHPATYFRDTGSIHLFDVALHKCLRLLQGLDAGEIWPPQLVVPHEMSECTIDTETTSLNPAKAELVIATVTDDTGTVLVHADNEYERHWFRGILEDENVTKNFQNGDYDVRKLEGKECDEVRGWRWDTMLAEHLLHEETHYNLELLRGIYTNQPVYERPLRLWKEEKITVPNGYKDKKIVTRSKVKTGEFFKNGNPKYRTVEDVTFERIEKFKTVERGSTLDGYGTVPPHILHPYGVYDSQTEHMVWRKQQGLLGEKKTKLLQDVVLPMQRALIDMEREGIKIDVDRLPEMRRFYLDQEAALAQKVFQAAGDEFKLTSPPEVRKILYEELRLPQPPLKSKKTGIVGTGKKALDWLTSHANHPIIEAIGEWRATNQLIKAFLGRDEESSKGLMSQIQDGRLYATFRLTLETGRNSSSPNLQNLPQMTKGPIRELLIAAPGNVLLQLDYSQIELRIAAYAAEDWALVKLLEDGADVHTIFARRLYPFEPELSDNDWKKKYDAYRTMAKRFTFGRLYGQGEQGMALTFNIPTEEALRFQTVYAELFPRMAAWWDKVIDMVRSGQALETVWGRTRYFPAYVKFANIQWRAKNGLLSHMDRESLNFIPQGTAADCLSKATGTLRDVFKGTDVRLRLVVHDALTVECPEEKLNDTAKLMAYHMARVGEPFGFKLPVEAKWGYNWATERKLAA